MIDAAVKMYQWIYGIVWGTDLNHLLKHLF